MLGQIFTISVAFGFLTCLTIDNQVNIVRNDCYERLAIGEKLNFNDIDKILTVATVQDCQLSCTEEQTDCRTFSFGIGVKGNASCELSKTVIKETSDLKPIGTIKHVDYDLYIKKLGCKLVLSKDPVSDNAQVRPEKPLLYSQNKPQEDANRPVKPIENNYNSPYRPHNQHNLYGDDSRHPNHEQSKPHVVQSSLMSISSISNHQQSSSTYEGYSGHKPSEYGVGKPYYPNRFNRPDLDRPFNDFLNYPYNNGHYQSVSRPPTKRPFDNRFDYIDEYDKRKPTYGGNKIDRPFYRPLDYDRHDDDHRGRLYFTGYNYEPNRPDVIPVKPDHNAEIYGTNIEPFRPLRIPERPSKPIDETYDSRPVRPSHIPQRPIEGSHDYNLEYGPVNRPNDYESRPHRPFKIPERPGSYESRPLRPSQIPHRPIDDFNPEFDHINRPNDYESRPHRPPKIPERPSRPMDDSYESRPERPSQIPHRPIDNFNPEYDLVNRPNDYDSRPHRPSKIPERPSTPLGGSYDTRPIRPLQIPHRPIDDFNPEFDHINRPNDYDSRPHRPTKIPERPSRPIDDPYESRPVRPSQIPHRPIDDFNPEFDPENRPNNYESRPHRPTKIPERPSRPIDDPYESRPVRPSQIPHRPIDDFNPEYDPANRPNNYESRPHRPQKIPERPSRPMDDSYESRPIRPPQIPQRPIEHLHGYNSEYDHVNRPNNYESRPHRPNLIPPRPLDDYPNSFYDRYDSELQLRRPFNISHSSNNYDGPLEFYDGPKPERPLHNNFYYLNEYGMDNRRVDHGFEQYRTHQMSEFSFDDSDNYLYDPYRSKIIPLRLINDERIQDDPDNQRPYDNKVEKPFFKLVVYNTDFRRPIFVPLKPIYPSTPKFEHHFGQTRTNEEINGTSDNYTLLGSQDKTSTDHDQSSNSTRDASYKPIVTQVNGPHGETITSIITEIRDAEGCSNLQQWSACRCVYMHN